MDCVACGSAAVTERPERTARGYRRFRCRDCGKQFNERSAGLLDRAQYPSDVIAPVVPWRLRHRLTLRDLAEMSLQRGVVFSHEAVRDWEAKLAPALAGDLRHRRHGGGGARGRHWHVDETYLKVGGRWAYLYRAIDRDGDLVDTMLSQHRDMAAAQAFFRSAKAATGVTPDRVTTDGHGSYPRAIRSTLGRRVVHRTGAYKNLWPAPSASSSTIPSDQSTPTYPVSGHCPGQDGDPRVPVLITTTASSATSCSRIPERRSTVRPSRFHRPQTSSAARAG
jgi:putative transposase